MLNGFIYYSIKNFIAGYITNKYVIPKITKIAINQIKKLQNKLEPVRYF